VGKPFHGIRRAIAARIGGDELSLMHLHRLPMPPIWHCVCSPRLPMQADDLRLTEATISFSIAAPDSHGSYQNGWSVPTRRSIAPSCSGAVRSSWHKRGTRVRSAGAAGLRVVLDGKAGQVFQQSGNDKAEQQIERKIEGHGMSPWMGWWHDAGCAGSGGEPCS
jgi:hypothetical protein